jgi:hypothetical protein
MSERLRARFDAIHALVSGGFSIQVAWPVESFSWVDVLATKSNMAATSLELIFRNNIHMSMHILAHDDKYLMQTVDHTSKEWVEACAVTSLRVRARDLEEREVAVFIF